MTETSLGRVKLAGGLELISCDINRRRDSLRRSGRLNAAEIVDGVAVVGVTITVSSASLLAAESLTPLVAQLIKLILQFLFEKLMPPL